MKLVVVLATLLLLTGCGGGGDSSAEDAATTDEASSASPEDGETSEPSEESEPAEPAATLPESGLCDAAASEFRPVTGGGKAVDLAPGDSYPGGVGEARQPSCFQRGPGGASVELIAFPAGEQEGKDLFRSVEAGEFPESVCETPRQTGADLFPEGVAVAACASEMNLVPGTIRVMTPVEGGHLLCIAALPPDQPDVPPAFVAKGGSTCGDALLATMGL